MTISAAIISQAADSPTLYSRIMDKDSIKMPEGDPMIMVFIDSKWEHNGVEFYRGLQSDGELSRAQWQDVFEHVGHLYPYFCRLYWMDFGSSSDNHLLGGLDAGIPIGGSIGGSYAVLTQQRMEDYWYPRYETNFGLAVDYWFQDMEGYTNTLAERIFFKTHFVDAIEDARDQYSMSYPKVYTNWMVSRKDSDDFWNLWESDAGVTHGNVNHYYQPQFADKEYDKDCLLNLIKQTASGWHNSWLQTNNFCSAWIGNNGNSNPVPGPAQYSPLVSLESLLGCRWFMVFPMNNGSLAVDSITAEKDLAEVNADCVYNMAQAASWFQKTSARFLESVPDVVMLDGSATASGNAIRITGSGTFSDYIQPSMPDVVDEFNSLGVGEYEFVFSWDIKATTGPDTAVECPPRFTDIRIWGNNAPGYSSMYSSLFYSGKTRYLNGNDVFTRYDYHFKIKIVSSNPSSENEFVQNSFTDFKVKLLVSLNNENFTVDIDNMLIKDSAGNVLNPDWDFDNGVLGTDLMPSTSNITTSNVTVSGRNGGNGVRGLGSNAMFVARVHETLKHYWFAGYKKEGTGSSNASVPLPFSYGRVKNMATGQTWNITTGLVTIPINQNGNLYYFRPVLNPAWNFDGARSVTDLIPESGFVNGYTEVTVPTVSGYGYVARLKNSTGHDYTYPSLSIDQAVNALNSYTSSDGTVTFTLSADIKGVNDGGSGTMHPRITTLRILGDNSDPQSKYVISTYLAMQPVAYDGEFYHVSQQFTLKFVDSNPSATNEFVAGSITGVDIKFETDSDGVETQWAEFDNIEICAE